jgi:hypothetical protein
MAIDMLHERAVRSVLEMKVWTPLVAQTDPKVSPTPSSNRFTFTLAAFV